MNKLGRLEDPPILGDDERQELEIWESRPKNTPRLATRARIVLDCAGSLDDGVAARLGRKTVTVGKWRKRFLVAPPEGLNDEPRPGASRAIADPIVERVLAKTLAEKPRDATHRCTRGMAQAAGMSWSAIVRIWNTFGLKHHRGETLDRSTDPHFVGEVRDDIGLYMSPPQIAIVLTIGSRQNPVERLFAEITEE